MQVMTGRGELIDVVWPPRREASKWCLGASADGRFLVAYRAGLRGWVAVPWEALRERGKRSGCRVASSRTVTRQG